MINTRARREKVVPHEQVPRIIADWRTGQYTVRELADKYRVSKSFVGEHVKGVTQDTADIVDQFVVAKQRLANVDPLAADSINQVVDEKTKHIQFFTDVAVWNVQQAMKADCRGQSDYRLRAETILKGKEVVIGKTPETAIQINTQVGAIPPHIKELLKKT